MSFCHSESDHLWHLVPDEDSQQQSKASLSLKPDHCHPILASRAAPGAMMSVSPSPAVNTDDHGGNPWGREVLQSLILNHPAGENKSPGTGQTLNGFWGFGVGMLVSLLVVCENKRRCETSVNEAVLQTLVRHGKLVPRTRTMRSPTKWPELPVPWCSVSDKCCSCSVEH